MGTHLVLTFHESSKFTQCGNIFLEIEANQQFDHDHLITIKRRNFLCYQSCQIISLKHFYFILPRFPTSHTHTHTHAACPLKSLLSRFLRQLTSASAQMLKARGHAQLPARPKTPHEGLSLLCLSSVLTLGAPFQTQEITSCSSSSFIPHISGQLIFLNVIIYMASLMAQAVKNLPACRRPRFNP